jgi:basic membrane protein A
LVTDPDRYARPTRWMLFALGLAALTLVLPGRGEPREAPAARGRRVRVGLVFDVGGAATRASTTAPTRAWCARAGSSAPRSSTSSPPTPTIAPRRCGSSPRGASTGSSASGTSSRATSTRWPGTTRRSRFACIDYAPPMQGRVPPNVTGIRSFARRRARSSWARPRALHAQRGRGLRGRHGHPPHPPLRGGFRAGVRRDVPVVPGGRGLRGEHPVGVQGPREGRGSSRRRSTPRGGRDLSRLGHHGARGVRGRAAPRRFAIGVDADQHDEMPGVVITSMIKRVDVAVFDVAQRRRVGPLRPRRRRCAPSASPRAASTGCTRGPTRRPPPARWSREVEALRLRVVSGAVRVPRE